jgi:hypothetical protein
MAAPRYGTGFLRIGSLSRRIRNLSRVLVASSRRVQTGCPPWTCVGSALESIWERRTSVGSIRGSTEPQKFETYPDWGANWNFSTSSHLFDVITSISDVSSGLAPLERDPGVDSNSLSDERPPNESTLAHYECQLPDGRPSARSADDASPTPFLASFLVRDDGGAHLNPALENRVAQFGLSPSRNPGILLLTHAHSKPKNNPTFHRRVACGRFCQRGHETFAPLPFRAVGCIFKGPSRWQSARCLPRGPWLKR